MNIQERKQLAARPADRDTRCPLCQQIILGLHGRRTHSEIEELELACFMGGPVPEPAHPFDTLDWIVKLDGKWVHADCAADAGHEVLR